MVCSDNKIIDLVNQNPIIVQRRENNDGFLTGKPKIRIFVNKHNKST